MWGKHTKCTAIVEPFRYKIILTINNIYVLQALKFVHNWHNQKELKTLAKFENSQAGENAQLCLEFSQICSQILPNIHLGFHQAMKAQKTCFIS